MILSKRLLQRCLTKITAKISPYSTDAINIRRKEIMERGLPKKKPIAGVKHIIVVSSGKGGVGKSTTSVNLATAMKLTFPDKNIGLLDTDIFGPSIPLMMNLHETPFLTRHNLMEPLVNYGVKCMSFGFLIEEGSPVIWRGLMVMQALEKLMRQVEWSDIDYLIVDTPPGTGDVLLSLVQNLPISGVVLVTTPQKAALDVTKRGASMYIKLNIPLIGLVENMSTVICPSCSNNISIFGKGTHKLAEEIGVEVLESFPLKEVISEGSDRGIPVVLDQGSVEFKLYKNLAHKVEDFITAKLSVKR